MELDIGNFAMICSTWWVSAFEGASSDPTLIDTIDADTASHSWAASSV